MTLCCCSFLSVALSVNASAADLMLLDFTADWCQPCQQLKPTMQHLVQQGWIVRQIDADKEAHHVQRWQVSRLPTIIVLRDGEEVDRIVGAATDEQLQQRLSTISGAPKTRPQTQIAQTALPKISETAQMQSLANARSSGPFPPLDSAMSGNNDRSPGHFANTTQLSAVQIDAEDHSMSATVRIKVDDGNSSAFGTGTIIDQHNSDVLVLTCGHLFRTGQGNSPVVVEVFRNGQSLKFAATVIDYQCDQTDIALLTFQSQSPLNAVSLRPSSEVLAAGEAVSSIGCDHGADPTRRVSKITKLNRYLGAPNIEVAVAPVQGRSGGGLFDVTGRLIGVCYAADAELDEGLYCAPAVVYQQLAKLGLERLYEQATASRSLATTGTGAPRPINSSMADRSQMQLDNPPTYNDGFPDMAVPQTAVMATSQSVRNSPSMSELDENSSLTVIVRTADGQQQVLEIPDASASLVQALQLQAMPRQNANSFASNGSNLR